MSLPALLCPCFRLRCPRNPCGNTGWTCKCWLYEGWKFPPQLADPPSCRSTVPPVVFHDVSFPPQELSCEYRHPLHLLARHTLHVHTWCPTYSVKFRTVFVCTERFFPVLFHNSVAGIMATPSPECCSCLFL